MSALIVVAIIAILAAIATPNYQEYQTSVRLSEAGLALDGARTRVDSLTRETENREALAYLNTAGADIGRAAALSRSNVLVGHTAEFSASINSAREQLEFAIKADPALANSEQIKDVPATLRRLEHRAKGRPLAEQNNTAKWIWPASLLFVGALLMLSVLVVVIFVGMRHGSGKPDTAKRWIRVFLEPVIAMFAIVGGLILVFYPGVEQSASTLGAGVAGSGIGFWLKSVG